MQPDFSDWMVPIEVMLGSLNHGEVQACSISSVVDELRESCEDAYKPKVISVGPLHRGATRHMVLMEENKWRYMNDFLDQTGPQGELRSAGQRLKDCGAEIIKLDKIVGASYGGDIKLEPQDLAKIMIVDGCFLLEFLHRLGEYMDNQLDQAYRNSSFSNDPIFESEEKVISVLNDITMLENQIPFVVLKKLYRKVFPNGSEIKDDHRVANIVRRAFGHPLVNHPGGAHILHTMHLSTVEQNPQLGPHVKPAKQELLRCATRLRAAGIIIQPGDNTVHLNLVDRFNFDIGFSGNVLTIPKLVIKETTEVKWRNLIAWEQSRISNICKYTSYALFFQGLICCKHDIDFLEEIKVIVNEARKSKDELLALFCTMAKGVEHMDSSYSEYCASMNQHPRKKATTALKALPIVGWHQCRNIFEIIMYYWRNWFRILIRDHIPTVWKFIAVLAATALLVLTIMQTYYSARSSQ